MFLAQRDFVLGRDLGGVCLGVGAETADSFAVKHLAAYKVFRVLELGDGD